VRGIQQEQQRPFRNLQQRKKFLHASSALQSSEFFKINEREKKRRLAKTCSGHSARLLNCKQAAGISGLSLHTHSTALAQEMH
jgi:hypothetical protein